MELLYGLVLAVVVYVVLRIRERLRRLVYKMAIPSTQFEERVAARLRAGGKNFRVFIYDPLSATLLIAQKHMRHNLPEATVGLTITRKSVPEPKRFDPEAGKADRTGQWVYKVVPKSRLPKPDDGELLERVNCGGSLSSAMRTVAQMVTRDPLLAEAETFYVWTDVGRSFRYGTVFGRFED